MSDKIRAGESEKAKARKPRPADDEEDAGGTSVKKSGSPMLWVLLAVGALFLCGLPVSVGLVAALFWFKAEPVPNRPIAAVDADARAKNAGDKNPPDDKADGPKVGDKKPGDGAPPKKEIDQKPPPAEVGKAPWGTAPVADLGPEIQIWDYAIRLPKGYEPLMVNKQISPLVEINQWRQKGGQNHMDIARARMAAIDPLVLYKQDPQKSMPNDLVQFEVYRGPQEVLINNMRGARQWKWTNSKGFTDGAVVVSYRFEVAGTHYVCNATAHGKSREDAEKAAALLDVSLCTLRKR